MAPAADRTVAGMGMGILSLGPRLSGTTCILGVSALPARGRSLEPARRCEGRLRLTHAPPANVQEPRRQAFRWVQIDDDAGTRGASHTPSRRRTFEAEPANRKSVRR